MKGRNYLLAGGLAAALFGLAAASGALGSGVPVVAGGLLIFAGAGAALVGWFIKQGRRP